MDNDNIGTFNGFLDAATVSVITRAMLMAQNHKKAK